MTDQTAEQYLRQITLPNSVQVNDNTIFARSCKIFGFDTIDSCQISYWWYNGAIDDGAMALAPLMPFGNDIAAHINISYAMTKALTQYPLEGVPQTVKVGVVSKFPVFFACGVQDNCDLCDEPKYDSGVVGLLPHTSNWDFTLAPLMFCINAKAAVKSSLSFLLYFGFPVHPVVRKDSGEASTAGNQTKSLGDSLKQDAGWLALWLSGYVGVVVVVCVVLGAARIGKEVVCGVVGLCVVSWCYCVVVVSWCLVVSWSRGAVVSSGCGVVV